MVAQPIRNLVFCLSFLLATTPVKAQMNNLTNATSTPIPGAGHDYIKLLSEVVDPANGSLSVRIATPVPPGRLLTLPFSFAYDSNGVWVPGSTTNAATWGNFGGYGYLTASGWSYLIPRAGPLQAVTRIVVVCTSPNDCRNIPCVYYNNWTLGDVQGGRHNLGLLTQNASTLSDSNCYSVSLQQVLSSVGPTFSASVASTASDLSSLLFTDVDGTTYSFAGTANGLATKVEDRNGNLIAIQDSGSGVITETDTLGRTALSTSGFGASGNTVTVAGLSSYQMTWGTAAYNFNTGWSWINPGNPNGCTPAGQRQGTQPVVSVITLPNLQRYQFFYDAVYGLLNKIVYPSGATVTYAWGENPLSARGLFPDGSQQQGQCLWEYGKPAILHRYVSFDGVQTALQQDFQYTTTWGTNGSFPTQFLTKQTVITTSDLIRGTSWVTTYLYAPGVSGESDPIPVVTTALPPDHAIPLEQTITFQDSSGHTLRTLNKTWANAHQLLSEQTTLDNGLVDQTAYSYGPGSQVTEKDEYDFGSGAPGGIARKTVTNYQAFAGTSILDRPSTVMTYDGNGNELAETDYSYDQGGVGGVGSLPTGTHDETKYSASSAIPRGNVTTVTQKCLQNCTDATTTYSYDETGQILARKDPCGNATCSDVIATNHTTTYSYSDSYASCGGSAPPTGSTNAYLTQIIDPVGHATNFCYGYLDGQLRGSTDANSQTTVYKYNDALARLTETDHPDGGFTKLSYNDTPYNPSTPSPSVTTTRAVNSSTNLVSVTAMDGLGQVVQTQLSDPNPNCSAGDITKTTLDGSGRPYTVTNPYCTASDPTYGVTTYFYDPLGRITKITRPDGNTALTTYTGRATQVQDEGNGSQPIVRISQVDGLGRLTYVCELASGPFVGSGGSSSSSLIGTGGTPAPCGLDISGTGFLTGYQYDALDNLKQVNQSGVLQRNFSYDSLSRLASAANPESGTTCYGTVSGGVCQGNGYDVNGNLATKTDARGIATSYTYNAINQLLAKTYSDGTPGVSNTYDAASVDGLTISCPAARLVKTATTDGKTATVNSYDQMGRIQNQWQCTPQNCGTGYFSLPYGYDFAGNITLAGNGMGVTIGYGTFNSANELTKVTSNLSDTNHPATLLSNPTYTPFRAIATTQLGNTANESFSYDARLRLQSSSVTDPTGGSAKPGTGTASISGSEQSTQVQTQAPIPGQGSVTISCPSGADRIKNVTNHCCYMSAGKCVPCSQTYYDHGTVTIYVNGWPSSANYIQGSSTSSIATVLASAINSNSNINSIVSASPSSGTVNIRALQGGAQTNYSLSATSATTFTSQFSGTSFPATASGSTLTGGQDAVYSTVYDTGTVSISVNGSSASSYTYGQGDTANSIAGWLVSRFSSPIASASLTSPNGASITITANSTGYSTNYAISTSSSSSNGFSPPSFSASGSNMTGGMDNVLYTFSIGTFAPNGDVVAANDSMNGNFVYGYDPFNRLVSANQNSGQAVYNYVYDIAGNRWQQNGPSTMILSFTGNGSGNNNRADGYSYDLAGNLLNDGATSYTYDAENRIITAGTSSYVYDADGRRIRKTVAGGSVDFLYDLAGHEITEVSSTGTWNRGEIYAGGRHLATYSSGTTYFNHSDWLGTERMRTSVSGSVYETCTSLAFGDWLTCTNGDSSPMHFTGKERDFETGLDFFGARYDSSNMGRFISPDSTAYVKPINPQSWNLYAYARNNPLLYIDPTGSTISLANCQDKSKCVQVLTNAAQLPKGVTAEVDKKGNLVLQGDLSQIKGGNAARLLQLVQSDKTANFWIGDKAPGLSSNTQPVGGGLSGTTSQGYNQNFAVVQADPSKVDSGDLGGVFLNPDGTTTAGTIPGTDIDETAAHELLGHVWADLIGGEGTGTQGNLKEALIAEDRVRNTDPSRGLKIRHQDSPQLIKTSDLPRITNPGTQP